MEHMLKGMEQKKRLVEELESNVNSKIEGVTPVRLISDMPER